MDGEIGVGNAKDAYDNYVWQQLGKCSKAALARLIHAAQDRAARGHCGYQPWNGGYTPLHIPGLVHGIGDIYPSDEELRNATNATIDITGQFERACKCK